MDPLLLDVENVISLGPFNKGAVAGTGSSSSSSFTFGHTAGRRRKKKKKRMKTEEKRKGGEAGERRGGESAAAAAVIFARFDLLPCRFLTADETGPSTGSSSSAD